MSFYEGRPCAACKHLRRKCAHDCVLAPFFPPENTRQFEMVHGAYGASNVSKLLKGLPPEHLAEAAHSLVHDATRRHHDPVDASAGYISALQQNLKGVQYQLLEAKKELHFWLARNAPQHHQDFQGQASAVSFRRFGGQEIGPVGPSGLGMHDVGPESSNAATQRLARMAIAQEMMRNGGGTSGLNQGFGLLHSGDDALQAQQHLMENFGPDAFQFQQPQLPQEQAGPTGVAAALPTVFSDE